MRLLARDFQDSLARAATVAEESLGGVRTVKAFAQENFESDRYERSLTTALVFARQRIAAIAIFIGVAMSVGLLAISFVLAYGGSEVLGGRMSLGDLTQFLLYLMIVAFAIGTLGSLWGDLMSGIGASKRVFELLDRQSKERLRHSSAAENSLIPVGALEFSQVHFSYPSRKNFKVLDGISFSISRGKVTALVGASGSGKSTIAQLLLRFYPVDGGRINVAGIGIDQFDLSAWRKSIGYVSQEPVLISASIRENISYGHNSASEESILKAARDAHVLDFVERFPQGLDTLVGERGIQLSGGQKQRVAIARAILKDPQLLILDEATSSLDTESEHLVQEALQKLMKGRTTLVIAHRLSTIKEADQIIVLQSGQIVQKGTHNELLNQEDGLYRKLLKLKSSSE